MPTNAELEDARVRWQQLAADGGGLASIAGFQVRRLEALGSRPAPDVRLQLDAAEAARAVQAGEPLLLAGGMEVDLGEVEAELRDVAALLRDVAEGPARQAARAVASAPISFDELLAAALRGDGAGIEAGAFQLDVPADEIATILELAVQPALWAAAEQAAVLNDFLGWHRGYCPVCGAWPLYAELVGAQKERHLRCGRCGARWAWAVLLCPYCGNDDHRTLGFLENPDEREHRRVDVCDRCKGYLKAIASFTPAASPQLAAEDAATVHLDLAARERGYARPGTPPDPALAGVPRSVREPAPPQDMETG